MGGRTVRTKGVGRGLHIRSSPFLNAVGCMREKESERASAVRLGLALTLALLTDLNTQRQQHHPPKRGLDSAVPIIMKGGGAGSVLQTGPAHEGPDTQTHPGGHPSALPGSPTNTTPPPTWRITLR